MSLEALMEQYVDGDIEAYETLYPLIYEPIRKSLRRWLKRPDQIDDATQITLLKVHSYRSKYRRRTPVIPWVVTIARNVAIDLLRLRFSQTNLLEPVEIDRIRDQKLSEVAWNQVEERELINAVRDGIEQLPEEYRDIVRSHKIEGYTMREIAESLGVKENTVKVRAHRGYKQLARLLSRKWRES